MKRNPQAWTVDGDVAYIELGERRVVIDAADVPRVSMYRWYMNRKTGYVLTNDWPTTRKLHRVILGLENGDRRHVDHRNHTPWDNRRSELRIATRSQNMMNKRAKRGGCGYKGVQRSKKRFAAQIVVGGNHMYLGHFQTQEDAARAYDAAARQHFGAFACVNFP